MTQTIPSQQVLDIAFHSAAGVNGIVASVTRRIRGGGLHQSPSTALQKLLDDVAAKPAPDRQTYRHPGRLAGIGGTPPRESGLTSSEIAWMQGLPANPGDVSYDDAYTLARLSAGLHGDGMEADRRLVDQRWRPVRELHDRRQAEVNLHNARVELPTVPSSATAALAEAISAEVPELRADEALLRARAAIEQRAADTQSRHHMVVADAERALAEADAAPEKRTAVTAA